VAALEDLTSAWVAWYNQRGLTTTHPRRVSRSYSAAELARAKDDCIAAQGDMLAVKADLGLWMGSQAAPPPAETSAAELAERVADTQRDWQEARHEVRRIRAAQRAE